jgi:diguanylate cyclase (GGDEF)-like protein
MQNPITFVSDKFFKRAAEISSPDCLQEERRIRYVFYTVSCTLFGAIVFIPLHFWVFDFSLVLLSDVLCLIACIAVFIDFWKCGNLNRTAWLATIVPSAYAITLFWLLKGQHQISTYLIIPPGFAFLLLGRHKGIFFGLAYVLIIGLLMAIYFGNRSDLTGSSVSIINFWGALFLAFFWGYSGERARNQSFSIIENIADTDPLTAIVNRRRFFDELKRAINSSKYNYRTSSMLMIDIDFFKSINDTYGHDVGDRVLIELTQLLRTLIRNNDTVGRIGGEEFCILLREISLDEAINRAEIIRQSVEKHKFDAKNNNISLTISIGVVMFSFSRGLTTEDIYKAADKRLYKAKQAGRNRVVATG